MSERKERKKPIRRKKTVQKKPTETRIPVVSPRTGETVLFVPVLVDNYDTE